MAEIPKQVSLDTYLAQGAVIERYLRRLFKYKRNLIAFDIGACEGEESIRYSRMFPRARIYSFEPLSINLDLMRANFSKYGVTNAEVVPVALSDSAGVAKFHVSTGAPTEKFSGENWNYGNKSSSLLPPAKGAPMHGWITFPEEITVDCETLDRFCALRNISWIDFMHMDVQGGEYLVLKGGRETLPKTMAIWLEVSKEELYRGQALRGDIELHLRSMGFRLCFEEGYGVEANQLYVNLRIPRSAMFWAALNSTRFMRKLFRVGAAVPTGAEK
jgi:FkbM family methyltransferase